MHNIDNVIMIVSLILMGFALGLLFTALGPYIWITVIKPLLLTLI
jgi:hypothetical protein